jgi:hypothetical protein
MSETTVKKWPKFHVQGEVTIYVDYIEEDAETREVALKAAKDWLRSEYHLYGMGFDEHDINITVEEVEADE